MAKQKDITAEVKALAPLFWDGKRAAGEAMIAESDFHDAKASADRLQAELTEKFDAVLRRGGYSRDQIQSVNFADGKVVVKAAGEQGAQG